MAEMKDSGIHAIGRIPKEWNVVRTKYLSNISIGLVTTMTENYVEKEEGVPLIRNGNIRCNKIDVNGMVFLDKRFAEKNKHRQLHTGQIATVHTGDVGTSIVIPEEYDGCLGFATIQSTPYKGVSSEFLCWFYNSAAFKNQCIECSTGDGRQNLNLYDFVDLFVAIPKYDLQSKIASFLDKKCAEIDSLHTDIEKQIETLEEYKKSIITETVLNDPESSINKSMRMWSEFSINIDYGKLTGLQAGLQQLADQMPKIDMSSFAGLHSHLGELLNTDNIINSKFSEVIDYAYETAKEEAGEPEISKEELENVVREEIKNDTLGEADIENNKFKEKFYAVIKFFLKNVLLPLALSLIYDLGKAQLGKVITFSAEDNAPVIYEIQNKNTYVNIIDKTDKKYRVFFIDDDGNVIDGYMDKENINMNFEDDEDEQ